MSGPKLQPNGWWEQDRNCTPAEFHRAGRALAEATGHSYSPETGFVAKPRPAASRRKGYDAATGRFRGPDGRFRKRPRNKVHNHPPKARKG